MRKVNLLAACNVLLTASCFIAAQPSSCEKLSTIKLPETTIVMAQPVTAGALTLPAGAGGRGPVEGLFKILPAFCRVAATLTPTTDSDIKIEVWLPASGWNGKFQAVGNGGWSGAIGYPALARALSAGYATASTDTGHSGGSGSFALGHPEKLIDFAYRSEHEMTVKAKAIIAAYYGSGPKLAYWNGCSSGGKQGLKEAQRFPADYDGIIAGAPANYWTHLMASSLWIALAVHKDEASYIPPAKYPLIHRAVLEACDTLDGVKDGVLEDPTRCRFDPKILECRGADNETCLTTAQVRAVEKIYGGAKNPRTDQEIFPGLEPGSEMGWAGLAGPEPFSIPLDHFKYVVFKNPGWDWRTIDFDKDIALSDKMDNGTLAATDPDLKTFVGRGGKLLLYHGWNDQLIAPRNTINYYRSVTDVLGGFAQTSASVRLFMVPGMNHCGGGDGPSTFDMVSTIDQWVAHKNAPEQIAAAHLTNGATDRARPLCPYPQVAQYRGTGTTDDATNFVCKTP